jgi:hypothetical protein
VGVGCGVLVGIGVLIWQEGLSRKESLCCGLLMSMAPCVLFAKNHSHGTSGLNSTLSSVLLMRAIHHGENARVEFYGFC